MTIHTVTVDKNGQRVINNVDQNRTITFKYKNISLSDLNNYVRQKELAWLNELPSTKWRCPNAIQ
ncbi:hypothetical protein [Enterococcus faecium]